MRTRISMQLTSALLVIALFHWALVSCGGGIVKPPDNGPQFVINSPQDGSSTAGTMFFSAQPFDASEVASVNFKAGDMDLGTDTTANDGFKVFISARDFPEGALNLTATLTGKNGATSTQSITVNNIPNPPSSATVGSKGAALGTNEDNGGQSVLIIPAGVAQGASVSFNAKTKAEVKASTGVDYDALGVTFLGAQKIDSSQPLNQTLMVSSGGYGPMVQPGQAVVNYMIAPDADGDGVGELVVVNTASVAPNGDVISNPVSTIQLGKTQVNGIGTSKTLYPLQDSTISGTPGTRIQVEASGFNPNSPTGNTATFLSSVTGDAIEVPLVILPNTTSDKQNALTFIPIIRAGAATLSLRNESTNSRVTNIKVNVQTAPSLSASAAGKIIDDYFVGLIGDIDEFSSTIDISNPAKKQVKDLLDQQLNILKNEQILIKQFVEAINTVESGSFRDRTVEMLSNIAAYVQNDRSNTLSSQAKLKAGDFGAAGAIVGGLGRFFASQYFTGILFEGASIGAPAAVLEGGAALVAFAPYIVGAGVALAFIGGVCYFAGCFDDSPPPSPCTVSAASGSSNGTTGMGSAPPPGGSGCGSILSSGSTSNLTTLQAEASTQQRYSVKIFNNGKVQPFTGVADTGGYFYIPFMLEGQPFKAIAYEKDSGVQKIFEGIGPAVGNSVYMSFNFFDVTGQVVENLNDSGPGSLRDAVVNAQEGDLITFKVTGTITLSSQILINKSLRISGPSSGSLTISGGGSSRIFEIAGGLNTFGEFNKVFISGLTLANGRANQGGAIYSGGDLTIADSVLTNNTATDSGGAIYNAGGTFEHSQTFLLSNATVSNNTATVHGGGVFNYGVNTALGGNIKATIRNSTISGNIAQSGIGGGLVSGEADQLTLTNTEVSGNRAALYGGGMYLDQTITVEPSLIITDSTITGNNAGQGGGGIHFDADTTITRTTLANNTAGQFGGGLNVGIAATLTLSESTVSGNVAEKTDPNVLSIGGGCGCFVLNMINSTVVGNKAKDYGGGIDVGVLTTVNSTITGNDAGENGGGISLNPGGNASVKNSIIFGNTSASRPDFFMETGAALTSLGYNIVGSADGNTFGNGINNDLVGVDPLLGSLADNGGPTLTVVLQTGSPAIDAVPSGNCKDVSGNAIITDQRGVARPQGSACDIGAFEKN